MNHRQPETSIGFISDEGRRQTIADRKSNSISLCIDIDGDDAEENEHGEPTESKRRSFSTADK